MTKIGRNDPCPSGTGDKFKMCLAAHREKGREYPLNLLDYLNTASLDRLVATKCGGILRINLERTFIMLDACVALTGSINLIKSVTLTLAVAIQISSLQH